MKHGVDCLCDECFRISANEQFPFIRCEFCEGVFEAMLDFERHWHKFHKEEFYKDGGGGGSIRDMDDCLGDEAVVE